MCDIAAVPTWAKSIVAAAVTISNVKYYRRAECVSCGQDADRC
jgi:hypothetical protein